MTWKTDELSFDGKGKLMSEQFVPTSCCYLSITFVISFESSRGTKRLVSVNICSVEGNSADIFVSKVSPGIFVIKVK